MSNATFPIPAVPALDTIDRALYAEAFLQRWDVATTRESYRTDLATFFAWCDSHQLNVFTLHRVHLEVFVRYLGEERRNCVTTIHHRIGTIRQFYELALDDDLIAKNPTRMLKLPKRPPISAADKALTPREFERMAWAAAESNPTDYALILTMGMCGLRVTPACSLDVETATIVEQAHRMFEFVNKGGERMRVPQPPAVIQAVDRIIEGRESGPLFLRRDGSRMTRSSADRVVQRLAKRAGIARKVSPHTMRHTFSVTSLDSGVPLEAVALSLGHKDSSTTFRHYGRKRIPNNQHSSYTVAGSIRLPNL